MHATWEPLIASRNSSQALIIIMSNIKRDHRGGVPASYLYSPTLSVSQEAKKKNLKRESPDLRPSSLTITTNHRRRAMDNGQWTIKKARG